LAQDVAGDLLMRGILEFECHMVKRIPLPLDEIQSVVIGITAQEHEKILDLRSLIPGKNRSGEGSRDPSYLIYPGDRIDVDISLF